MSSKMLYKTIQVKKKKTIASLLKELGIENNYFAVLVNNKSVNDLNHELYPQDKIVILPKIKGGM